MRAGRGLGLPDFLDSTRVELARQAACYACSLAELIAKQLEGTEEIACCAIAVRVSQLMSVVLSSLDDEGVGVRDLHFQLYNNRRQDELEGITHG